MRTFDIYDFELAEVIFDFMADKYDEFCKYLADTPQELSLAEYVDTFYRDEFKEYCMQLGYCVKF